MEFFPVIHSIEIYLLNYVHSIFLVLVFQCSAWNYTSHGISWATVGDPDYVAACSGTSQSPINIVTDEALQLSKTDIPSLRNICGQIPGNFKIDCNTLKFETADGNPMVSEEVFMSGGPLNDAKYYFWYLQLHWGSSECPGSEHTVNNNRSCFSLLVFNFFCDIHLFSKKVSSRIASCSCKRGLCSWKWNCG